MALAFLLYFGSSFLYVYLRDHFQDSEVQCSKRGVNNNENKCKTKHTRSANCFTGYIQLSGGSNNSRLFSSPRLNGWKCIRFWYYSGVKYFKRSIELTILSHETMKEHVIWSHNQETISWTFVQLPINMTESVIQVRAHMFSQCV